VPKVNFLSPEVQVSNFTSRKGAFDNQARVVTMRALFAGSYPESAISYF